MDRTAMLPGSFDPPTVGHMDIIRRTAAQFEKLYVVVADNIAKHSLFTVEERMDMLRKSLEDYPNIIVTSYPGLMVNFAKEHGVGVMVRGVRALNDFSYEFDLAMTNKMMEPGIEVFFIPTDPKYFLIRSSQIKEMAAFGADISGMVEPHVLEMIEKKITRKN